MPPFNEEEKINRLRRAIYSRKFGDDMGVRERRELEQNEPAVAEDWKHDTEQRGPGFPTLETILRPPRPSRLRGILKWAFVFALLFFLGAVAFFIYYLYLGGASSVSARNIDIEISGPSQLAGGEIGNLEINVTNHNREALELSDLVVTFPPGTRVNPSSCTGETCTVALGTIGPGASDVVKLPAVYEGGAGQHANVSAELDYQLSGSSATFVASSEYGFVFTSSPLSITVNGNTQAVSGQPMQITVTVSSNTDEPVDDVLLSATMPFGFQVSSVDPAADKYGLWDLGTLSPGVAKTITINGVLSGEVNDDRVFHFTAGTQSSATSTTIDDPLADTDLDVGIAKPFLDLALSVNSASSTQSVAVAPGSIVNVSVAYTNNLSSEIDNAVIVARLSGLPIDGTTVHSEDGFYRSTDSAVIWDKTTSAGQLATVASGASGTFGFSFQMPSAASLVGVQDPMLDISVSAAGQRIDETGVPENLQSTADQKIAVASDLELTAQGLYFTDPFGASGPMPPQAQTETTYAIAFAITNTTNTIQNAVVTAALPPYVRLVGNHYKPASENVNFDSDTGEFTWNVGDIAPGVGLNGTDPRQVVIEVGLTPSTSQIGLEPVLLQNIQLTGTDSSTGAPVNLSAPDITTNITSDPGFSSINAKVVQ